MGMSIYTASTAAERMRAVVLAALAEAKGAQVRVLEVRAVTDITDYMIVATGTSQQHVKTLAERVQQAMQQHHWKPFGVEGLESGDWVLVDFVDVVVHIMRAATRERYQLESLWDETLGEVLRAPPNPLADSTRGAAHGDAVAGTGT